MMAKMNKAAAGFYNGECEGSGSSGRIDVDISKYDNLSIRKCVNLYSENIDLNVHMQTYPCSAMSSLERKNLAERLKVELEELRRYWKKAEMPKTNGSNLSSTSDILSCGYRQNGQFETMPKTSIMKHNKSGKKPDNPVKKGCNRGMTGRFYSGGEAPTTSNAANASLMKKCESILKKLMAHHYGWVFKSPVDVVKLNIPDYFTIIKHPMDLGTVKKKLSSGLYRNPLEFFDDVNLTFSNAMTYNPPGNDVHIMADTLNKLFESQCKDIRKKLQSVVPNPVLSKPLIQEEISVGRFLPPSKKRKLSPDIHQVISEPAVERIMSEEEKHKLGLELEAIMEDMPISISDFLRQHSSCGIETGEDEIEIDIEALSDDILFTLRKLLQDHFKQKNQSKAEPCEIELLNESGLSNSSMQPDKGNEPVDEDVDVGENEPPVSSYPPMEIEKDVEHRSSNCMTPNSLIETTCGTDHVENMAEQKPCSKNSDANEHGDENTPTDSQMSPDKLYRAALLKNRFADTILKAREKTLKEDEKDPEKLQKEKEELQLQRKQEKSRLQAEAKAAEDAKKRAEEEAAAEAKRKRDIEREAARQALLEMEKTVEINENARILQDLEMLKVSRSEQLPSLVGATSPENADDGVGGLTFGGSNPLEQLGLYMKQDDDEDEPAGTPAVANENEGGIDDIEEGEL